MTGFTRVIAAGNLTHTPELRQVPSGDKVTDLRVAVTDHYRDKGGEKIERACFLDVIVWGRQAELCGQYLEKGSPVLVDGRLQQNRWETAEGQPRSRLLVRAERVQFLPFRRKQEGGAATPPIDDTLPTEKEVGF